MALPRRVPFTAFVALPVLACGARSDLLGSDGQGGEGASPASGNTTGTSPTSGTTGAGGQGGVYLSGTMVPGAACELMNGFFRVPDGGVIRWCGDRLYHDESGNIVYPFAGATKPYLYHVGYGDQALTIGFIVNLAATTEVPIVGIPMGTYLTARAQPDGGFWVAFELDDEASLYSVSADGFATQLGSYPPPPSGIDAFWYSAKMDATGALYEIGTVQNTIDDVVVRRPLGGGASEIVFDEVDHPLVKLHSGNLFTGP